MNREEEPTRAGAVKLDLERQRQAESYAHVRLLLRAVSLAISLGVLLVLGPLRLAAELRDLAQHMVSAWPLQVLIFFAVLGAAIAVIELPLTYYSGYVLPHHYGLSNQTFRAWVIDLTKAGALGAVLAGVAVEILYGFLRLTPDTWWIWTGVAYALIAVVLATLAPILILPLFFKLSPLHDASLAADIRRLADRAGAHVQDVCEINLSSKSPAANAAVIGMGRTRKIMLGDTLLSDFPRDEVEVVVAHELGHHVHRDVLKSLALSSVLSLSGFAVTNLLLHAAVDRWHFSSLSDLAAFPVLLATLGVWGFLTGLVQLAFSRHAETHADDFSLTLTGLPSAFVNSEVRLTNQNLAWFKPPAWQEFLFSTHPAPWRRVAMGERYLDRVSTQS